MQLGYARVSTREQDTALQLNALRQLPVLFYWEEQRSGVKARPALEELLDNVTTGCVVVVYKVDRLARSLVDLLRIIDRIEKAGGSLRSLTEPIDTGTPAGRMILQLLGVFAEFERSIIRERCEAGRVAARERGKRFGRRRKLDYEAAIRMRNDGKTFKEIAAVYKVAHATVVKAIQRVNEGKTPEKI